MTSEARKKLNELFDYLEEKPHKFAACRTEINCLISNLTHERVKSLYEKPRFGVLYQSEDGIRYKLPVQKVSTLEPFSYEITVTGLDSFHQTASEAYQQESAKEICLRQVVDRMSRIMQGCAEMSRYDQMVIYENLFDLMIFSSGIESDAQTLRKITQELKG